MMQFAETLHRGYGQHFEVTQVLYREKTDFQDLVIFENPVFGRILALDGVIQTTERDNHIYHEMLAHVPILAHGAAQDVLIIGGGDGGTLREVVKHPLRRATMVEIDGAVIELSKRYLPKLSAGAFDDPKAEIVIADGLKFVAESERRFDVIIVDSTDPIGPGEVLFTERFYRDCKRCLTPGGILVTQNGVPLFQPEEVTSGYSKLSGLFADVSFFLAAVPTYAGGAMALGWASDDKALRRLSVETLHPRFEASGIATRYYSPAVHAGSFALPPEISALMG
jgi:spermidine synthase